jgi:hypothetical protein
VAAQQQYRLALEQSERSGATFIWAVASVGLVSVQAAAGQTHDALVGYQELMTYFERTGAWTQQWTTLRNLADLFDRLGEHDASAALRAAADAAPEASTVVNDGRVGAGEVTPGVTREEVLALAREVITRQLAVPVEV